MGKKSRKKKALEAEIVRTVNDVEGVETLNKVFVYNSLNVHSVQRKVWGEAKSGVPYNMAGFELILRNKRLSAKRLRGETIVGKLYQITDDQLEKTEEYCSSYKKHAIEDVLIFGEM